MTGTPPSTVVVHPDAETAATIEEKLENRVPDLTVASVTTEFDAATEATLSSADVLVTFELPETHYAAADPSWIHAMTAGVDDYDLDTILADNIILTNASGVNAEPVAEQVLGYMLSFARRLHRGIRQQERGEWEWYGGRELAGKTALLVGVGAIGSRIAQLCEAFEMTSLGIKRDPRESPPGVAETFAPDALSEVLPRADYVVLACPLTSETRGLIGDAELRDMQEYAVLVNVARGPIVDESALVNALERGDIGGAALDVFEAEPLPSDSPLWNRDDVILTPHMAGSTPAYWDRNADLFADNYAHFVDGEFDEMRNRID